jgi:hypothetical protein
MPERQVEVIRKCDGTLEQPSSSRRRRSISPRVSRIQSEAARHGKRPKLSWKSTTLLRAVIGGGFWEYTGNRPRTSANTRGTF